MNAVNIVCKSGFLFQVYKKLTLKMKCLFQLKPTSVVIVEHRSAIMKFNRLVKQVSHSHVLDVDKMYW